MLKRIVPVLLLVALISGCKGSGSSSVKGGVHFRSDPFVDEYMMDDGTVATCVAERDRVCYGNSIYDRDVNRATIYFAFDRSDIKQNAPLDELIDFLNKNDNARVYIGGHTDKRGGSDYNIGLGLRRAASVANYLKSKNVSENRMFVTSHGSSMPVSSIPLEAVYGGLTDRIASEYAKDRRVECFVEVVNSEDSSDDEY